MKNKKRIVAKLKPYLPLIFIIGIFVFLCAFASNRAVWFDESYSAQTIKGDFLGIAETTAADVHPPLYYWLLKIWTIPFGRSIVALRSFSIFCGVIAVIFAYLTFKRWSKSNKRAIFLTSAFAICPFFLYYSTEIRMYSLVCAIVMASVFVLDLAIKEKKLKYWIIYAILLTTALYTHYFSGFAFLAEYIFIFFRYRKEVENLGRKLFFVSALALLLYLPWIPSLISQVLLVEDDFWIEPFTTDAVIKFFSQSLIRYEDIFQNTPGLVLVIITLVAAIFTAISAFQKMEKKERDETIYIACLVFIPLLSLFLLSLPPLEPVYISRYLTYSLTFLWVLIAILIVEANKNTKVPILSAITFLLMVICAMSGLVNVYKENEFIGDFERIISEAEGYDAGAEVPVIFDDESSEAFNAVYYQTDKHHVYILNAMSDWYAARPLSRFGDNYIEDFEAFQKNVDAFWYILPKYVSSAKAKRIAGNSEFKLKYSKPFDDYTVYRFQKEKDLKTTENLL